ncbi:MAG: acetoacetate decarboxylase family protein [Chloroflexi bacterium]|nr:acetoacetate decarboxylase family protein [Chloroflexota bacterium]
MPIPLSQVDGMPVSSSYFPRPPARYRGMRAQTVLFRADPNRVANLLPECLTPAPDGECAAIGVDAPWSSHYGAFQGIVVAAGCQFEGRAGYYVVVQYLNSRGSIPAGREIWGTPKVWADMRVEQVERVMATTASVGGVEVAAVRSTAHLACDPADLPDLTPMWRLKVIPRADGDGLDVLQLVSGGRQAADTVVHVSRAGDGVVEFRPSPVFDVTALEPREFTGAFYVESDFTEDFGVIDRDFLKEPWEG